jgi:hypothetical protein
MIILFFSTENVFNNSISAQRMSTIILFSTKNVYNNSISAQRKSTIILFQHTECLQ